MTDLTRADLDRIHERLDQFRDGQTEIKVSIARTEARVGRLEEKIDEMPKIPSRPCPSFENHIAEHKEADKEAKKTWKDIAIKIAGPAITGAGASIAMWLGLAHK